MESKRPGEISRSDAFAFWVFGNLCGWEEGARLWIQQALGGVEAFRLGRAILGSVNGQVRCNPRSSPTRNPEARNFSCLSPALRYSETDGG